MTITDGTNKFVFSVRLKPVLAAKLKAYGGDNFSRNVGELFELLEQAGLFDNAVEIQRHIDATRAQSRVETFARVRELIAITAAKRRADELLEADRIADEDQRQVAAENAARRAGRIAAGLPVSDDPIGAAAEPQHPQGELLPWNDAQVATFAAVSAAMTAPAPSADLQEPDTPDAQEHAEPDMHAPPYAPPDVPSDPTADPVF